jgi:hypothetical protein
MPKKGGGTTTGSLNHPNLVPTISIPEVPAVPTGGTRNPF